MFRAKAHRIGFQRQKRALRAAQLVTIAGAFANGGQKRLPNAGATAPPHRVAPPVPMVEIPHHRDPLGIRGPDGEMRALMAFMLDHMRAKHLPQPFVAAFA